MADAPPDVLRDEDLPAVAGFIARSLAGGSGMTDIEAGLRWRTIDNPARPDGLAPGTCARRADGSLAAVHIESPRGYRLGGRRLLGLASTSLFSAADARLEAYLLFRRFLARPGFDFHFANTCNAATATLWARCGGRPLAGSDLRLLVPLRLAKLAPEKLRRGGWPWLAGAAGLAGRVADLVLRPPTRSGLPCTRTDDLDLLATIAERLRDPALLVPDRGPAALAWLLHAPPPQRRPAVFRFHDHAGRDGWFAVRRDRHAAGNVDVATLVDWVLPEGCPFRTIVLLAIEHAAGDAAAVAFAPRRDTPSLEKIPRLVSVRSSHAGSWISAGAAAGPDLSALWVSPLADAV